MNLLAVGLGGAIGAIGRYWLSGLLNSRFDKLPLGTLSCNVIGSLLMGIMFVVIVEQTKLPAEFRHLKMVGFLGAFTTFSSFSLETVTLFQEGHIIQAFSYILLSVVLCIAVTAAAIWCTRQFF